jgi:hypothetical protein
LSNAYETKIQRVLLVHRLRKDQYECRLIRTGLLFERLNSVKRRVTVIAIPWMNLTLRHGALSKSVQDAMMATLIETLMLWEK